MSAPTPEQQGPGPAGQWSQAPGQPERSVPRGPSASTTSLGLFVLVLALVALASQVFGTAIDWRRVGPWVVIGSGGVIALLGVLGLLTNRRRD